MTVVVHHDLAAMLLRTDDETLVPVRSKAYERFDLEGRIDGQGRQRRRELFKISVANDRHAALPRPSAKVALRANPVFQSQGTRRGLARILSLRYCERNMKGKRGTTILLGALLVAGAAFALSDRRPAAQAFNGEPEIVAATFTSQWCSACRILKPRLLRTMRQFDGQPVKFVEYDLTFGPDRARPAAAANGLSSVYERFSAATGYTLLVDVDTGEIVGRLTIGHSQGEMRAAIAAALDAATAGPPKQGGSSYTK